MIYAIWLINRSGTPIIARTYRGFNVDSVLFSGLITAILSFAKEISGHEINEISMGNFKILVNTFIEGPILVMAVSSEDEKEKYIDFVEDFRKRIVRRYGLFEEPNIKALPIITRDIDTLVSSYGFLTPQEFRSEEIIFDPKVQKILSYMLANEKHIISPLVYVTPPKIIFPEIDALSLGIDSNRLIVLLDSLSNLRYLSKKPSFSIPLCPKCGSAALVFHAVCPHCGSTAVTKRIFIEHFKCGYIGPSELFKEMSESREVRLICPSCREVLGTNDYRMFESYYCDSCSSIIKTPTFKAYCPICNEYFELSEVNVKTYYSYSITKEMKEKLENIILKALITSKKVKQKAEKSIYRQRFQFFKKMAEYRQALRAAKIPYMTLATLKNPNRRKIKL